jgi:hypothetical protein
MSYLFLPAFVISPYSEAQSSALLPEIRNFNRSDKHMQATQGLLTITGQVKKKKDPKILRLIGTANVGKILFVKYMVLGLHFILFLNSAVH